MTKNEVEKFRERKINECIEFNKKVKVGQYIIHREYYGQIYGRTKRNRIVHPASVIGGNICSVMWLAEWGQRDLSDFIEIAKDQTTLLFSEKNRLEYLKTRRKNV